MTDSNLVQLAYVEETTWGVTPNTPAMKLLRYTGESIAYEIQSTQSAEIVTDRQVTDLILTGAKASGGYNFELSYKEHDDFIGSALMNNWAKTPEKDNSGVADSVITAVTGSSKTFTVVSGGTDFKFGHLIYNTNFIASNNNGVLRVTSSTGTTVVASDATLTDESIPPANARMKVVGFQGAASDLATTSTGLHSTALDFTTLGLSLGSWIKIGGVASGDKFATSAVNDWVRIIAITANDLTFDHRPSGWTTDSGSGKTVKIWFGDTLTNGTLLRSFTIEKGFLGQTVPNYLSFAGETVDQMSLQISPGSVLSGSFTLLGKSAAAATTTPLDASPDPSKTGEVLNAVNDVGLIAFNGSRVTGPNYIQKFEINTNNNLRDRTAVGFFGLVGVGTGQFNATGSLSTYFGDATIWNQLVNNTAVSLNAVVVKNKQTYVFQLPRVKLSGGTPSAGKSDQDVVIEANITALKDITLTNKTIIINRLEYME